MKGLMIHDFYCLKKQICLIFKILLVLFALSLLFILAAEYGNLKELVARSEEMALSVGIVIFGSFAPMFMGVSVYILISEKFKADKKGGWAKQALSLPVSDMKFLGSAYSVAVIFSIIGFIISLGMTSLFFGIGGEFYDYQGEFTLKSLSYPLMMYIIFIILAFIQVPVLYALKSRWKATFLGFFIFGILILISNLLGFSDKFGSLLLYRTLAQRFLATIFFHPWVAPIIIAVAGTLSYFASLLAIKGRRREKLCGQ